MFDLRIIEEAWAGVIEIGWGSSTKTASIRSLTIRLSEADAEKLIGILSDESGNAAHWSAIDLFVDDNANGDDTFENFPLMVERVTRRRYGRYFILSCMSKSTDRVLSFRLV